MKAFLCVGLSTLIALILSGCASKDFPNVGSDAAWYERTDPHAFLLHEEWRGGPALFIGLYDADAKDQMIIPGVSRRDPLVSSFQTCTVGSDSKASTSEERRYLQAVTNFARRYNPEMLALLKQYPESRVDHRSAATPAR